VGWSERERERKVVGWMEPVPTCVKEEGGRERERDRDGGPGPAFRREPGEVVR
jgi:hypothetical protein